MIKPVLQKGEIQKIRVGDNNMDLVIMVILLTGMRINKGPPTTGTIVMAVGLVPVGVVPRRIHQGREEMITMGVDRTEDHQIHRKNHHRPSQPTMNGLVPHHCPQRTAEGLVLQDPSVWRMNDDEL